MASLAMPVASWVDACATNIINSNITAGYVNQYGLPMSTFTGYTWGVDHGTCYEYCGKDKIYQEFDFNNFAADFTSWLLPWLALTAQLPFQAKSSKGNLMSLYMAVGSPAMITYSLTITILNRNWVRQKFKKLQKQLSYLTQKDVRREISERLEDAQYLLQESQQVPMRASQSGGWLSSLIVLKENDTWWKRMKKDVQNSRRGYTFSLVAQIGMALIAYSFTIAITLTSAPLGVSEGSSIEYTAGGGLWAWMIPVIWGWIMCGTQDRSDSITDALDDETAPAFRMNERGEIKNIDTQTQRGICSRSGLIPLPITEARRLSTAESADIGVRKSEVPSVGGETLVVADCDEANEILRNSTTSFGAPEQTAEHFLNEQQETIQVPTWLGLSIEGDEALEGPIFNYARLFTFREFSSIITKAFHTHISSLTSGKDQYEGISDVEKSCGLDRTALQAYTPWRRTEPTTWHHILIASIAAIVVQWGTTGPAIMMAYLTPTIGLGCRSGSYLIYGVLATLSWILITCSSLLSHAVNLRYQEIYTGSSPKSQNDLEQATLLQDLLTSTSTSSSILTTHRPSRWHKALIILTILTRIMGKSIAAINAIWIVLSSIFEYTGVYSQCWCDTNAATMGTRGWVVLFASNQSFQDVAKGVWVGGVLFSFGVCLLAWVGFWLGCRRSGGD